MTKHEQLIEAIKHEGSLVGTQIRYLQYGLGVFAILVLLAW
jgi:hypothetical protein